MKQTIRRFRNLSLAAVGLGGILGCESETPVQPPSAEEPHGATEMHTQIDEATGEVYLKNPNRRLLSPSDLDPELAKVAASPLVGTHRDWSGQVQVNLYECSATGDPNVRITCEVGSDDVLVGGGARIVNWSGSGALLQETRPMDKGLYTWAASSKSHLSGDGHSL